jgi:zinc transporter ZupT
MVSSTIGWTVTISIIIHEAIQEISEFFVLRRAGYSAEKALRINLAVSSTIFIGVVIGSLAFATINLEGILLALTAGFFLHVVIHDLLPLHQDSNKRTTLWNHVGLIAVGAGLMLGAHSTLRDVHVHGDDHTDVHTQEKNHATTVIPEPEAEHVDHDH